jgi:glutathione S-transferase
MDDMNVAATGVPDFNIFGWPYTGLVTLFTLGLYLYFAWRVAAARSTHKVAPPLMTGPEAWMRLYRVQMNTGEHLIIFLPLLWITAFSTRDEIAAAIGILWPIGRILYSAGYLKDPKKRLPGFFLCLAVVGLMFCLSAVQLVRSAIAWQ